ncbi:MAG: formate/nitrite transporter family protein [Treponema sp.]|jgi:formate/nitrite transporter|nr:formate/nitrite transporter family protein [Treponema sp.]
METRTPVEILAYASDTGLAKTQRKFSSVLILAFFAGIFIAFAAGVSTIAAYNLYANPEAYGLGRAVAGVLFGSGLMLVILGGGELFTGSMLIVTTALDRRTTVKKMFLNWLLVYIGNLAGSILIAWMIYLSGLFNNSAGLLGGVTITIAASKTSISFIAAFVLGVLCNLLVCFTVWTTYAAKDAAGKVLIIFFLILLFATSGFEHSVANMYYIPAGIFAKLNPQWLVMSQASAQQIAGLNWLNFAVKNLIPVTLGNIIGGVLVGFLYWVSLGKNKRTCS